MTTLTSYSDLRSFSYSLGNEFVYVQPSGAEVGERGNFYWDAACTDPDDGGTVIGDFSPGAWRRVYSDPIDLRWFGAVCNGSDDDTTAFTAAIAIMNDGDTLDLLGSFVGLADASLTTAINICNGTIVQIDGTKPALTCDLTGPSGVNADYNFNVKCTGTVDSGAAADDTFAALKILTGDNKVTCQNMVITSADKTALYVYVGDEGLISLINCEISNNGNIKRSTLSSDIDDTQYLVDVVSDAPYSGADYVYIGDAKYGLVSYSSNVLTLANDGTNRTPTAGFNAAEKTGQYVTMEKNGFNGCIIDGAGELNITNSTFDNNAWFGLFNRGTAKTNINNSQFSSNGFIGVGSVPRTDTTIINCIAEYNSNNGIDNNAITRCKIALNQSKYNGVDGIFIGYGEDVILEHNTCFQNRRNGICIDGSGDSGAIKNIKVINNTIKGCIYGVYCTVVSDSSFMGNIYDDNEYHVIVFGATGITNPQNYKSINEVFLNAGTYDFLINVSNYTGGGGAYGTVDIINPVTSIGDTIIVHRNNGEDIIRMASLTFTNI